MVCKRHFSIFLKQIHKITIFELINITYTVKLDYSKNAYNKVTLTGKIFSFSVTIYPVVNLKDITKYAFNEENLPVPGVSLYPL